MKQLEKRPLFNFQISLKGLALALLRLAAIGFLMFGCEKKAAQKEADASPDPKSELLVQKGFTSKVAERYCASVGSVQLRTQINEQMQYFCTQSQPTKELKDLIKALSESPDGKLPIKFVDIKHQADLWSEFKIVWGFKAPSTPLVLKERPIYEFISKGTSTASLVLSASATRQPDELVDHGLHLWSAAIQYDLLILGSNNLQIPTKRGSQYNLYQLKAGVEDMGLGVEHLVDENNEDYKLATMLNLSFTDDSPGSSGSVNLALSHIKIYNRGFPKTAETAMREISEFLATTMQSSLK